MNSEIQNDLPKKENISNKHKPSLSSLPLSSKSKNPKKKKQSFFLMTLEDISGKSKQIKIYQNSNPSELAYNFCKENNLDFSSMKYIKANIKSIVKKFNDIRQNLLLCNNNNNCIKEEDEEEYLTEGTMRSNEKTKINDNENNFKRSKSKDLYIKKKDETIQKVSINNNINIENKKEKNINNHIINNINNIKNGINKKNIKNIGERIKQNSFNTIKDISNKIDTYNNNNYKNTYINTNIKNIENIENKNLENYQQIKGINSFSKKPLKINPISPKQKEINENFQKIKINLCQNNADNNNSFNIISNGSTNNIFSVNSDIQNNTNKNVIENCNDKNNSAYISIWDKEVSISQKVKNKIENYEKEENSEQNHSNDKKSLDINDESIDNDNLNNNDNLDYNFLGEKYINIDNEMYKSIKEFEDEFMDNGTSVLNNKKYYNTNSEPIKKNFTLHKNKTLKQNSDMNTNNLENNKYENKINEDIVLNKMKKNEITLPKKNKKNNDKDINKLYNLIKNSFYNLSKLNHNNRNIKKNSNFTKIMNMKIKEINTLDNNNEISRNIDTDPNSLCNKEFFNNIRINEECKINNNQIINTNFNNYIENNKINNFRNNKTINQTNDSNKNNNYTYSLNRHYFFSNPNLSSNQVPLNKSNKIYNNKGTIKYYQISKMTPKSKSLGRVKKKNKKLSSKSKSKKRISTKKKNNIIKVKINELLKEKAKRFSLPFKKQYISNKSVTPNINERKKGNYWSLKSCQSPIKKNLFSQNYFDNIISKWILSTIGNESRNIFSKKDNYFNKINENNQESKSLSEIADLNLKKSNFRLLLSKSNFKKNKHNNIANKINYSMRNKIFKDNNVNDNKKILRSLKIINNSDSLRQKSIINNSNNIIIIKNSETNLTLKKSSDRNVLMDKKKRIKKILTNNVISNHVSNNKINNINTINEYSYHNNRLIKNNIHNFVYDSTEVSNTGNKFRKIIKKQLTSPPKILNNHSKDNHSKKSKKISCDKIYEYKNYKNKIDKHISMINYGNINQNNTYENNSNNNITNHNRSIHNLINSCKNKNFNYYISNSYNNGNNYYVKNSGLKKRKNIKTLNHYYNLNENARPKKRLINFSKELANFYLNTEIGKNNFNNNLTYSNLINNCKEIKSLELSSNEKLSDEIIINILNKIFIFFNKEKNKTITLKDSFYKKRISFFDNKIKKILDNMIEILCKIYRNKRIYYKKSTQMNKNSPYTTKNNNNNPVIIDKNNFINQMLYIYKNYLTNDYKKIIISNKNHINKLIQENLFDKSFCNFHKTNNNKIEYISPKSHRRKYLNINQTEAKNKK